MIIDKEKKYKESLENIKNELTKKISLEGNNFIYYSSIVYKDFLNFLIGNKIFNNVKDSYFFNKKNENLNISFQDLKDFCSKKGFNLKWGKKTITKKMFSLSLEEDSEKKVKPAIVVAIMGNVNSGKTTFFKNIPSKKEEIKEIREEGNITQNIRSFLLERKNESKITFVDTPGHSVFSNMRKKCSFFIDVSIIMIDAKEGLKSETIEVIRLVKENNIPSVILINEKSLGDLKKNEKRIKSDLQLIYEIDEYSDNFFFISGNIKNDNERIMKDVIDSIDIFSFQFPKNLKYLKESNGIVVDSFKNDSLGNINVLFIKEGNLKEGDYFFSMHGFDKISEIRNFNNLKIKEAFPGEIVNVRGIKYECIPGEFFTILGEDSEWLKFVKKNWNVIKYHSKENENLLNEFNTSKERNEEKTNSLDLILISDTSTTLESLKSFVTRKSEENHGCFRIIFEEVNSVVRDGIVDKIFDKKNTLVISFGLNIGSKIKNNFKNNGIRYFDSKVIYLIEKELDQEVKDLRVKRKIEKKIGELTVIKIFKYSMGRIIGCRVSKGILRKKNTIEIINNSNNKIVFKGFIDSMQKDKENISEAKVGQDCGLVFNDFKGNIEIGYKIFSYEIVDEE